MCFASSPLHKGHSTPRRGADKRLLTWNRIDYERHKQEDYFHDTCMESFVIVKGVSLVELFLAELTGVLFNTIVHIHMVLEIVKA